MGPRGAPCSLRSGAILQTSKPHTWLGMRIQHMINVISDSVLRRTFPTCGVACLTKLQPARRPPLQRKCRWFWILHSSSRCVYAALVMILQTVTMPHPPW